MKRQTTMRKFVYVEGDLVIGDPYPLDGEESYHHAALLETIARPAREIDYSLATLGWLLVGDDDVVVRFGQTGASAELRATVVTAIGERFPERRVTEEDSEREGGQ